MSQLKPQRVARSRCVRRYAAATPSTLQLWLCAKAPLTRTVARARWAAAVLAATFTQGGFAGLVTCPLDVTKTRLMLGTDADGKRYNGMLRTMARIYRIEGPGALMSGASARVLWMSLGGLVFLGCYEQAKTTLIGRV